MNLGIIQGRLSLPVNGHIQEFPNNWMDEFVILNECGLTHIEWLITKGSSNTNPAFSDDIFLETALKHKKILEELYGTK